MPKKVKRGNQGDEVLHLSFDRKVAPRGWYQHSRRRWVATVPNSFGLPSHTTCPGRTPFCVSCYGDGAEQSAGVLELLNHNWDTLRVAGTYHGVDAMTELLVEMLTRYRAHADADELTDTERLFRIHWDGDFFSTDYADAWATAITANPDITFWAYTRSFRDPVNVLPHLAGLPNLELYLSIDAANVHDALNALDAYDVHAAWCASTVDDARALAGPDRNPIACPENIGRIGLMTDGIGACVECAICPTGRRDITFTTSTPVGITRRPIVAGEPAAPAAPTHCRRVGCGKALPPPASKGRRREFCDRTCQVAQLAITRKERAHAT